MAMSRLREKGNSIFRKALRLIYMEIFFRPFILIRIFENI